MSCLEVLVILGLELLLLPLHVLMLSVKQLMSVDSILPDVQAQLGRHRVYLRLFL